MARSLAYACILTLLLTPTLATAALSVSPVGRFAAGYGDVGLSGLTFVGGSSYYAIDDNGAIVPMSIDVNSATGAVTSASTQTAVNIGGDTEGIAWDPTGNGGAGSLYVSNETGPAINQYTAAGASLSGVSVPSVYANARTNRSLESLAISPDVQQLWTANEEALTVDGPTATTLAGTTVRLGRFDRSGGSFSAGAQYAYTTDPYQASPVTGSEYNGVSDLAVLPDGTLLVLERQVNSGGAFGFQTENFIYAVDLAGATDVSGLAGLDGQTFTQAGKSLLWSGTFLSDNYEGLAVGPELDNGDYSLLLIADGDGSATESLYALRVSGVVPEPACLGVLAVSALGLRRRR